MLRSSLQTFVRTPKGQVGVTPPLPHYPALSNYTLQRHCTENSKQIFSETKLRGLVPYLCFFELFIYSHDRSFYFAAKIGGPIAREYINFSQIHESGNWERGRAVSFLEIHKSDLLGSVFAVKMFNDDIYFGPLLC
jgi:hypothetical protein